MYSQDAADSIFYLRSFDSSDETKRQLASEIVEGLQSQPKTLPTRLFYDDRGSALFAQITQLEEYYLTRAEEEILHGQGDEISAAIADKELQVVELGAGDGRKTKHLLRAFNKERPRLYYNPLDISVAALENLVPQVRNELPQLEMVGLAGDYEDGFRYLKEQQNYRKLLLFLGSNIGNMNRREALEFLQAMRASLNSGDFALLGFDLKKDPKVVEPAYKDSAGVTSAFNFNLLKRLNKEFGCSFSEERFLHHAFYDAGAGAMRSYLISAAEQLVDMGTLSARLGGSLRFGYFEGIHTESSYKYTEREISALAEEAGYRVRNNYLDKNRYFVDSLWEASD